MRVVHLNTNVRWGGGELQVLELAHGLRARGHEPILLARPGSELLRRARESYGLECHGFGFQTRYSPLSIARLRRLVRSLRADLLHLHDGQSVALGVPAARGLEGPALVVHRRISSPMRRNPWSRLNYRSPRVEAFIAVSEAARGSLLDIGIDAARTHVVPSGVDPGLVSSHERPDAPFGSEELRRRVRRELGLGDGPWVGTVGALDPKKDVATFVRMAGRLCEREPELRFLVVGDGRQRRELEALARTLRLEQRLRFVGHVPDACRYMLALDAFVFPSLREGSPGVVKEAMALCVPIVAAHSPGTIEVLGEDLGIHVPPGDPGAFADAVEALLRSPESARRRARAAQDHVLHGFSLERTVERTLEVYGSALRARGHDHNGLLVPRAPRELPAPLRGAAGAASVAHAPRSADPVRRTTRDSIRPLES